ncbi:MAG: autotransporter-associated beta strand repeat protein [Chthoniobacteraceae bacterium]|nr:autotransporter-associated beta strand repeat protein [Chthoniobacteraceae bacterium]
MSPRSRTTPLITGLAAILFASSTHAVTVVWDNPGIGIWKDAVNWAGDVAPVAGDDVRINNTGTAVIDSSHTITILDVILGPATGENGNLQMTGGSLTTTSDIRIGAPLTGTGTTSTTGGGTGLLEQSGGTIAMSGGNFNIGFGDTSVGTYNLTGGSFELDFGTIIAVGNRGTGTINQSAGSIYVRGPLTGTGTGTGQVNLGRNGAVAGTNPGTSSGSYTLSGGSLTAAQLRYGNSASGAPTGSTNVFNLKGGSLTIGTISIVNVNASNAFNFTGGVLSATSIAIPLTNNGGTLSPASLAFGSATAQPSLTAAGVQTSPIGTTTFTLANSYVQSSTGTLSIEIGGPGSNDFVDIGAGTPVGTATLAGHISVSLLNFFNPTLGSTFDVLTADVITDTSAVLGQTSSGLGFASSVVIGNDQRQVLRLTVVPEPGAFILLGAAGLFLSVRRNRRKAAIQHS